MGVLYFLVFTLDIFAFAGASPPAYMALHNSIIEVNSLLIALVLKDALNREA